jgi:hypothetical protein
MPPSRTRHALWRLAPLFPGGTDPGYGAAHGGATYRESRHGFYVLAALSEGGEGTLSEVLLQKLDGRIVELGSRDPGLFLGANDSPLWAFSRYRLTEERLTEKVRAARALGMPPSTAETSLRLRSIE